MKYAAAAMMMCACTSVFDLDTVPPRPDASPNCVEEDFETLAGSPFRTYGENQGIVTTVEAGQLHITVPTTTTSTGDPYGGAILGPRDLRGTFIQAELVQRSTTGPKSVAVELRVDDTHRYDYLVENDRLYARTYVGGPFTQTDVGYDPVQHRFLRIRHDAVADELVFETSPTAATWMETERVPRGIELGAASFNLFAGSYNVTDSWTAIWDNAVLGGPCPP